MSPSEVFTKLSGEVEAFDDASGLGIVRSGGTRYRFHCIEIIDGSRSIPVGAAVSFVVEPKFGHYEATRVTPAASS